MTKLDSLLIRSTVARMRRQLFLVGITATAISAPACEMNQIATEYHRDDMQHALQFTCADASTIARWAPKVYLHPYDHHRPQALSELDARGIVLAEDGSEVGWARDVDLPNAPSSWEIRHEGFMTDGYPTAHGGRGSTGRQAQNGIVDAPMYVKTVAYNDFGIIDIKYWFYYEFNGFQMFRGGFGWFSTKKRNFPLPRFGRHEGDWEHITIRLNAESCDLIGAFYAQHGDAVWYRADQLRFEDNGHPVVYSALNSHASYPAPESYVLEELPEVVINSVVGVQWLKVIDEVVGSESDAHNHGTVVYSLPSDYSETVIWRGWNVDLINLDHLTPETAYVADYIEFPGRFGNPDLDNSHIDRPPALPYNGHDRVFDLAKIAVALGILDDQYLSGGGPRSPLHQKGGYWNDAELPTLAPNGPMGRSW